MRSLTFVSTLALLASAAGAQCLNTAGGTSAGLQPTTGFYPADDEGRSPPIDMGFGPAGFPMAGAAGPLTHVVVGSNGEAYLTSGGAAVDAHDYSGGWLDPLRGIAGASPRIWPCSTDLEGIAPGWAVTVDLTVPGRCKINWIDVERYFSGGPQFSFAATLYDTGIIELSYGDLPVDIWGVAGVSIGNAVGTGTEASLDLTTLNDTGTLGLVHQDFVGSGIPSISGRTITLIPNGLGGYLTMLTCEPANNTEYGFGCHAYAGPDSSTFVENFLGTPAAKAALDGNAMIFTPTVDGYAANWLPGTAGALWLAPSGTATVLSLFDDDTANITPSVAPPVPGGTAPVWTIMSNGVLTADSIGNHDTQYWAFLDDIATAPALAFYNWRDYNPTEPGSGQVKYEETAGKLVVTFDGVYEYFTTDPATFQWQIDLATGDVIMVWQSMSPNSNTDDVIVGCTLAGTGDIPVSQSLALTPVLMAPQVQMTPMSLSASPPPVINPSTVVTYTATDLPEFVPGSGVYLSTCFLSLAPNPFGFDLVGILTTVPGCNAWIGSLDLDLGAQVTFTPTASWNVPYDNVNFAPGNVIAAQAISLFDTAFPLPNGESGGFLFSNGVRSVVQLQ